MSAPSSRDLLATLIELLADQENVTIQYTLESAKEVQDAGK